jgi:hypothetical protein
MSQLGFGLKVEGMRNADNGAKRETWMRLFY